MGPDRAARAERRSASREGWLRGSLRRLALLGLLLLLCAPGLALLGVSNTFLHAPGDAAGGSVSSGTAMAGSSGTGAASRSDTSSGSPGSPRASSGWTPVCEPCTPSGLYDASMVWDAAADYVVLFGGLDASGVPQSATWTYSAGTWTSVCDPCAPSARYDASMAYDYGLQAVVLYGGLDGASRLSDTWEYRAGSWIESCGPCAPGARSGAAMAYDPTLSYVMLYGGCGPAFCPLNDTWVLNSYSGAWSEVCSLCAPGPLVNASMAFDPGDDYMVLFGGQGPHGDVNATWNWTGVAWNPVCLDCPLAGRSLAALSNDSADRYLLLFGGENATASPSALAGTYDFVDGAWHEVNLTSAPAGRAGAAISDDPGLGAVLLFGGLNTSALDDAWSFDYGMSVARPSATPPSVENGQSTVLTTSASGGLGPYTFGWTGLPAGCSSANTTSLSCTPSGVLANTTYQVVATAVDRRGNGVESSALPLTVLADPAIVTIVPSRASGLEDVGESMNFTADATGGAGGYAFTWSGLPAGCSTVDLRVLDCTPTTLTANTTTSVDVSLVDADGEAASAPPLPFQVNVDPVVSAPSSSLTTVESGQSITFRTTATLGSGGYTFNWTSLPANCASANAPDVTCTVGGYPFNTTVPIVVAITDLSGVFVRSSPISLGIIVGPSVSAPRSSSVGPGLDLGQTVELSVVATGGVGSYAFHWAGLPNGCSGVDAPDLSCTPAGVSANTSFSVSVTITDGRDVNYTGSSLTLLVAGDPTVSAVRSNLTGPSVDEGQSVSLRVFPSGGSGDYSFNWSGLPTGCKSANTPNLGCTPEGIGLNTTFDVAVRVTDANGFTVSSTTLPLRVNTHLSAPTITASPSSIDAGEVTALRVAVLTGGSGNYSFAWWGLPVGCASAPTRLLLCDPSVLDVNATFSIWATVKDSAGEVVSVPSFLLTVDTPPLIPTLAPFHPRADLDGPLEVEATVSGGSGVYSFTWGDLPPGCASVDSLLLRCAPSGLGTFPINLTATDSRGVTGPATSTSVAVIAQLKLVSYTVSSSATTLGENGSFRVVAEGGAPPYTYAYTGLPSGCASENLSALECTPSAVGIYNVTVEVTDPLGGQANSTLTWRVVEPPPGARLFGLPATEAYLLLGALVAVVAVLFLVVLPLARGQLFDREGEAGGPSEEEGEGGVEPESPELEKTEGEPEEAAEAETAEGPSSTTPTDGAELEAAGPANEEPAPAEEGGTGAEAEISTPETRFPGGEAEAQAAPGDEGATAPLPGEGEAPPSKGTCPFCGGPLRGGNYCPSCEVDFSKLEISGRTDTLKARPPKAPPEGPTSP